jgi:hypothetical protein
MRFVASNFIKINTDKRYVSQFSYKVNLIHQMIVFSVVEVIHLGSKDRRGTNTYLYQYFVRKIDTLFLLFYYSVVGFKELDE